MKKVLLVCVAAAITIFTTTKVDAQIKIGVFDEDAVLSFMPGIDKIDTLLQDYVTDSLQPEYEYELYQFQTKDSTFKADSTKMTPQVKQLMKKEIAQHFYKVQNWQQYQQQKLQMKQQELLRPYLEKIYGVLQSIITEQKFTHVFKKDVFVYADKSEELMLRVLHRLKVPVPKEIEEQYKVFGLSVAAPATGGGTTPKPTPKKN